MAFLTSSSCAEALTCLESPERISNTSLYIHIHTSTSRGRDSSGLQRGPGPRPRGAQCGGLCHSTLSTEGGREQVLNHGPDKAQASSCCCHAKHRLVEGMQLPQQPKPTNCVAWDIPDPFPPQPSEQQGKGLLQPSGTARLSSQWVLPCGHCSLPCTGLMQQAGPAGPSPPGSSWPCAAHCGSWSTD